MSRVLSFWPFVFMLVALLAFMVLDWRLPAEEGRISFAKFATALGLLIAICAPIAKYIDQKRIEQLSRPSLSGCVGSINFTFPPQEGGADGKGSGPGIAGITFDIVVANNGGAPTSLTNIWLVPEGKKRDEADSLILRPSKVRVEPRDQERLDAFLRTDAPQDYDGTKATLILRDAAQREYEMDPVCIRHSSFGMAIRDIPIRSD